jgi:hypothetical protein
MYCDRACLDVFPLAPIARVKAILPSARTHPYRVTPWHCVVALSAYEYRDSNLEPYNEIAINVPFVVDRRSPLTTCTLRRMPEVPMLYVHHLPVSTEISRAVGVEFAGFPKFITDISFERQG